jgi:hypothetical protein
LKLGTDKTTLTKENEISDELYRCYSDNFKAQNADTSNPHEIQIETEYQGLMNKIALSNDFVEIRKHISKLKQKKSSGFDTVFNFMIKKIPASFIYCLSNCFNT